VKQNMTEEQFARSEICRIGKSLFERSYVHATAGNISVRLKDGFLITPTDACLGFLEPDQLAKISFQGQQVSGDRASKTMALHAAIYQATEQFDADISCIIHTHSTNCVALTLQDKYMQDGSDAHDDRELLPPITPYFVMKVGHVPVIPYTRPGDIAVLDPVKNAITQYGHQNKSIRAVMLSRLGPYVWNNSPSAAMATLEELEESAKLWQMKQGSVAPLTEEQISELRAAFAVRW
jgi:ribulose-5-phosphate 4-epimerase/fuculose-1-phosphate aldolase